MKKMSFPEWIQAITATAALVLSVVIFTQDQKIKTLTDVVVELSNITQTLSNQTSELADQTKELKNEAKSLSDQTSIMSQDYQLRVDLSKAQLAPVIRLKDRHYFNAGGPVFTILLENIGTPAHNVEFTSIDNVTDIEIRGPNQYYSFGAAVNWDLQITLNTTSKSFSFQMAWESDSGDRYTQNIRGQNGKLFIDPAKLISESIRKKG